MCSSSRAGVGGVDTVGAVGGDSTNELRSGPAHLRGPPGVHDPRTRLRLEMVEEGYDTPMLDAG
ncbi:hypothetical protein ACIRL2_08975 [Embleya sp. NPDC127516]|uniref:hypothetical protein n=1 Tax=Embleya sp. NPDC127516 TaxID=3363990 RepID=UPI00381CCFC9